MLDRYAAVQITPDPDDPSTALVVVEAGCHLGRDPYDPTGTATWERSLNHQLQRAGYALEDLGGISHQTVSGFLATGSSGGSIQYTIDDNLVGIRFIDGTGNIHDAWADDPASQDLFDAVGVSMGLLGVVSKITLRVRRTFNIFGTQVTTKTPDAVMDLFGEDPRKPNLADFMRDAPYTRLMWWPQNDFDRLQVWQATRMAPMPGFEPNPYEELGRAPRLASLAGSLVYTIIGNLDDVSQVPDKLDAWYEKLDTDLSGDPDVNICAAPAYRNAQTVGPLKPSDVLKWFGERYQERHHDAADPSRQHTLDALNQALDAGTDERSPFMDAIRAVPDGIATILVKLLAWFLEHALELGPAQWMATLFKAALPYVIDEILSVFVTEGTQHFWDTWMCGLPMDNQMDDTLWPVWFTELWVPIEHTDEVMRTLRTHYRGDGTPQGALTATGTFSCEIYGTGQSRFWLSPAYGSAVVRIDVFWFAHNSEDVMAFYRPFWNKLKRFGWRPHWGKLMPTPSDAWRAHYRAQLPKLEAFLTLRDQLDPQQIFVSEYWRAHLGIAPLPLG